MSIHFQEIKGYDTKKPLFLELKISDKNKNVQLEVFYKFFIIN